MFDEVSQNQPLAIDVYPYAASSTVLKMDAVRRSSKVLITWSKAMPEAAGQTLASLAEQCRCSEEATAARPSKFSVACRRGERVKTSSGST